MAKLSITLLGILLAIGTASWSYRNRDALQQPTLPVITVCPSGPPTCHFTKIQDAINAAPERQPYPPYYAAGAEIHVAPGIYEENLIILKNVILKGAGKDKTFLRPAKGGRETRIGILIASNPPGTGALIEGFTIQGNEAGARFGIVILGAAAGAHIRGNRFQNVLTGVYIESSIGPGTIEENDFIVPEHLVGCAGIAAFNIGRLKILRNTFVGRCGDINIGGARLNIGGGVPFQAPGERLWIEGNQVREIWIGDSAAIAIRKNTVRFIKLLEVEATVVEENLVRSGLIIGNIFSGIWVEDSSDIVIQKNVAEENQHGITVTSSTFRSQKARISVAIVGNRVVRNGFGIVAESLEYVTVCQGNEVTENKEGDYGVGHWSDPKPSPELKQKCEGN